jgi:hypothetical protein
MTAEIVNTLDRVLGPHGVAVVLEGTYGCMTTRGVRRSRGEFKRWRDSMAATPRKADYAWTTLARVLSFAKDRGRIGSNPRERGGRPILCGTR